MGARRMLGYQASLALALASAIFPQVSLCQEQGGFLANPVLSGEPYSIDSVQQPRANEASPGILNQGGVNSSFGQDMTKELGAAGAAGDQDLATKLSVKIVAIGIGKTDVPKVFSNGENVERVSDLASASFNMLLKELQ